MKVKHEDLVFWLIVGMATAVAGLFSAAIFLTTAWGLGGKLAMFAVVVLVWAVCLVPTTIFYHQERDEAVEKERKRWESAERERLQRAQLEERVADDQPQPGAPLKSKEGRRF